VVVRLLTVGAGAAIVFGVGALSIYAGYPAGFSTYALIPVSLVFSGQPNVGLVLALAYSLWCFPELCGSLKLSNAVKWILWGVGLLSLLWFVLGWKYGMTYQGKDTLIFWSLLNGGVFWTLLRFIIVPPESENWFRCAGLKCLMFIWATCWAFPYLGETP
jgi:hypothetical protein